MKLVYYNLKMLKKYRFRDKMDNEGDVYMVKQAQKINLVFELQYNNKEITLDGGVNNSVSSLKEFLVVTTY